MKSTRWRNHTTQQKTILQYSIDEQRASHERQRSRKNRQIQTRQTSQQSHLHPLRSNKHGMFGSCANQIIEKSPGHLIKLSSKKPASENTGKDKSVPHTERELWVIDLSVRIDVPLSIQPMWHSKTGTRQTNICLFLQQSNPISPSSYSLLTLLPHQSQLGSMP